MLNRIKRNVRLFLRRFKDCKEHVIFCKKRDLEDLPYKVTLKQSILPSSTFIEKKYNLQYVAGQIGDYLIQPGEVFSFWNIVGSPDRLMPSRVIRNNVLTVDRGGGLCQAAGAVYQMAVMCGLQIIERYNHSLDLYGDGPRACPVGLDAAVSYGYKDLRIRNSTNAVLRFTMTIDADELFVELHSDAPLIQREVSSAITSSEGMLTVRTFYPDTDELIAESIYKIKGTG